MKFYLKTILLSLVIIAQLSWIYYKPIYESRAHHLNEIELDMPVEQIKKMVGEPDGIKFSPRNQEETYWSYAMSIPIPYVTSYKILTIQDSKIKAVRTLDW